MRTAYLITSHQLPHQVLRLVSTLRRGNSEAAIVVHHDDRLCRLDRDVLDALEARRVEPPSRVGWGEVSHLKTVLRCLRWTLESVDFDWVVLLSGQDYPIRPVSAIEQSLGEAQVDAFIETRRCDHPSLWAPIDEFALRYHYRWRRVPRPLAAPLVRAAARAGPLLRARTMPSGQWIGVPAFHSPFGSALVCHRGSDWFMLSRRAVEALERFVRARPDVLHYYRRTLIPTESFVQTVLANDDSLRLSGEPRRYVVFEGKHATGPRVLRCEDLETMLASGADFGRKFDETVDGEVLDELDRRLHASGPALPPGATFGL